MWPLSIAGATPDHCRPFSRGQQAPWLQAGSEEEASWRKWVVEEKHPGGTWAAEAARKESESQSQSRDGHSLGKQPPGASFSSLDPNSTLI